MMPIGLDASLPLQSNEAQGFYVLNETIKDNVKQKVKMLMLTAPGERVMIPEYGVGLRNFLFENDVEVDIIERIQEQVAKFLPDISIVSLEVNKGGEWAFVSTGHQKYIDGRVYLFD